MSEIPFADRLAAPLDGVRRALLSAAVEAPSVRALVSSRDRRLAWTVGAHACAALALTVLFPAPLLVLIPIAFGVPHVAADLRYLVLRRTRNPLARASILASCGALLAVSVLGLFHVRFDVARVEVALGSLAVAVAGSVALVRRRAPARRWAVGLSGLAGIVTLGAAAVQAPATALVVLLHVHNVVALVVWLWLFRGRVRVVIPSIAVVAAFCALLASGAFIPATLHFGIWRAFGTNLLSAADWLAPGLPDRFAVGLASCWIFMQSVHYLVWLVLVPADARIGSGTVSFRRTFRDLVTDFGGRGVASIVGASLVVAGFGVAAPLATRNTYLALASFHVWLELAVLAFCLFGGVDAFRRTRSQPHPVPA